MFYTAHKGKGTYSNDGNKLSR